MNDKSIFDRIFSQMKGPDRTLIMGVLNVTPDSFSDGGKFIDIDKAVECAEEMIRRGADIIDIGGESSRPGAKPVDLEEERDRVVPVLHALRDTAHRHDVLLSVDTQKACIMRDSLESGAHMINDISALTHDADSVNVLASYDIPIVLMHMQGSPETMQNNPIYDNIIEDIVDFFEDRIQICEKNGIHKNRLILDPGIGFGKTLQHNLSILKHIHVFESLGCPILLGTSRKSFIEKIAGPSKAHERIGGSLASVLWAASKGVRMFRVHDVQETRQALDVYAALADVGFSDDSATQ